MNDKQSSIQAGSKHGGFTLIELSIVLVIIALIIGGVLVGKDMIDAAVIRSQISQLQKYEAAVNTFRTKYNWLPGDMPAPAAVAVGLMSRIGDYGDGDGNGVLQDAAGYPTDSYMQGEMVIFWNDLATAQLIGDPITSHYSGGYACLGSTLSDAIQCFPQCKLGGGKCLVQIFTAPTTQQSYYFLAWPSGSFQFDAWPVAVITPAQAFSMDSKIDDGSPFTGRLTLSQPGNGSLSVADTPGATACAVSTTAYNVSRTYGSQALCIPRLQAAF